MIAKSYIVSAVFTVYMVCLTHLACAENSAQNPKIVLERNGCFTSPCAVYRLEIFADGRLRYDGLKHAEVIGQKTAMLQSQDLQQLKAAFENAKFFTIDVSADAIDPKRPCMIESNYECSNAALSKQTTFVLKAKDICKPKVIAPGNIGVSHCIYGDKLYYKNDGKAKWVEIDKIKDDNTRLKLQELGRVIEKIANSPKWVGSKAAKNN